MFTSSAGPVPSSASGTQDLLNTWITEWMERKIRLMDRWMEGSIRWKMAGWMSRWKAGKEEGIKKKRSKKRREGGREA